MKRDVNGEFGTRANVRETGTRGAEKENGRLRRLVTELSLERLVLKDVAEGLF
jgi:hypothetical protein